MKIRKDFKKIFHFTKLVKQQRRDHYHKKPQPKSKVKSNKHGCHIHVTSSKMVATDIYDLYILMTRRGGQWKDFCRSEFNTVVQDLGYKALIIELGILIYDFFEVGLPFTRCL